MEVCKICNKECKNLKLHLRTAHHIMPEDYEETDSSILEASEGVEKEIEKMQEEKVKSVEQFSTKKQSLIEFLNYYGLTEDELIIIVRNFKYGDPIPENKKLEWNQESGEIGAKKLAEQNVVETTNLHVAEALQKRYNFKCVSVSTEGGKKPKTWKMVKNG